MVGTLLLIPCYFALTCESFLVLLVPFGKLSLGSMWKAAGTLIVEQGAEKLGFFEWFQDHVLNEFMS